MSKQQPSMDSVESSAQYVLAEYMLRVDEGERVALSVEPISRTARAKELPVVDLVFGSEAGRTIRGSG